MSIDKSRRIEIHRAGASSSPIRVEFEAGWHRERVGEVGDG